MLIWSGIILLLTLSPAYSLPNIDRFAFDGIDLLAHCLVFLVMGFLMTFGFKKQTRFDSLHIRTGLLVGIICASFGLSIELIQHFLPTRSLEYFDMLANMIGGYMGYAFFTLANKNKAWI